MFFPINIVSWHDGWQKLDQAKYEVLRAHFTGWPKEKPPYSFDTFWGDREDARFLKEHGIEFEVDKEELFSQTGSTIAKLADFASKYGREEAICENAAVQISVPDLGLLLIDEVDYMEDACTDRVQDKLNEGWRILAVCPPNAQRRPDYIFGRRKKKAE